MTNKKNTRRALLASLMALLLCFSSLMGTTYAWFTDSVTSANNVITSGNLDITLDYWNGSDWEDVEGSSEIFDENALWEPGYTKVVYLKLENVGSLALKYQLGVNVVSETEGKTVTGESIKLSDYIYMDVIENKQPDASFTREAALAAATTPELISAGYNLPGTLKADADPVYLALVVYMPSTVGNDANHDGVNIPKIELGVNVLATQLASESDSYDEKYDEDASVDTVAKANVLMAQGKDTYLIGANEPNSVLVIPADYTGTLTLGNVTVKAITAEKDANIVILGNVVVDANGPAISMLAASETSDPISAITAAGTLTIKGSGNLTAIAKKDAKAAFGIGGMTTTAITIEDVTINYVAGGFAGHPVVDSKYAKDDPEGGAAIGSGADGAVITLKNVIIGKAIGGSKAAGIGARYWTGVTITIDNCAIGYVEGGTSAAAIGGSRVSEGAAESGTTININKSDITAQGGYFGAGIGSGYDTRCQASQPLCTINITDSTINATGGKYAAGVGTGYHNAALAGEIKNSTVNAKSGEKYYKDGYTLAMEIGFGITDPTREGKQTNSKITVNGTVITMAEIPVVVSNAEKLTEKLASGQDVILYDDVKSEAATTAPYGNKYGFKLDGGVLDGNGNELYVECYGDDYGVMTSGGTIKNLTMTEGCRAVMIMYAKEDIILDNVNIGGKGVLYPINTGEAGDSDVKLIVTNSTLAGWTSYSNIASASFTNVNFEQGTYYNNIYGRVVKPYVTTTFTDCSFIEHMNLDLSGLANGQKVTFTNCTVNGQPVDASVFTVPTTDAQYDTDLFTVDLPSWATSINDCIIFN